jgi:polysaccharide biosynthesis protein PslH
MSMRVLFLLPHVPGLHAASGGARSTAHLIMEMAARHEVAVLCLRRGHDGASDEVLRKVCWSYQEVCQPSARINRRISLSCLSRALMRTPTWVAAANVPQLSGRLNLLIAKWRPDIVHIAYHVMGQYVSELRACGARIVLTQHEPGVKSAADAITRTRGLRRLWARWERAAWANYERRVMAQMDAVVAFTEVDRRTLEALGQRVPIRVIPLGIAVPPRPANPEGRASSVLFVGNFLHQPNVEAATRLTRSIFPEVLRHCPEARLTIVGPQPPAEIMSAAGSSVTVTGAVDSVVPFLDDASVVVAPILEGGGMRVKVLEALAAGKAVVASPVATSGVDVVAGQHLIVARDDLEFAVSIARLLRDPDERIALAGSARAWACAHLGWARPADEYERLHQELGVADVERSSVADGRAIEPITSDVCCSTARWRV